ncbi:MAG: HDIG domain-containing protein [Candidatus Bathyarchaeota archaeon]|nr:HDIG domain-containing protein [Candidatus Bathyarchaeota archaeon]
MIDEVERLAAEIKDSSLREKVIDLLRNPSLDLDSPRLPVEECPAGSYQHHSYSGGLLQHTIGVTKLSLTLCDLVEGVYGGKVERDTVLAGALIHDIMKCYTYSPRGDGSYMSSALGEKIDHLTLLVAELYKRGFPVDVIHVAASHHGDVSPVKPKTMEALIVSIADLADSELSRKTLRAAEYLLRQMGESQPKLGSSREALNLVQAKSREGWDGVRKLSNGKS